jgi:hypothetical protein
MENFKIKNKICFEAGGKREAGRDDKLTIFFMGPKTTQWRKKAWFILKAYFNPLNV